LFPGLLACLQSPSPPLFGCVNKAGFLPLGRVMLSQPSNGTMNPSDSQYSPARFRCLIRASLCSSTSPHWVSSTGLFIFHNMPTLLPRKIPRTASVFQVRVCGLPHVSNGSASSLKFHEATCRFTCVTACCFANWKLTTPCYQDAAPLNYRGARIIPRTGL
jgi:hypothetical protein